MRAPAELAEKGDGRCAIAGALTMETAPWLWQQLKAGGLLTTAKEADLAGVTDADSAGLALLVAWRGSCAAAGGSLGYRALPARIMALARLTGAEPALGTDGAADAAGPSGV
ncbi:MAG: STAS domain-containing protein [Steroidobacteraceae bacterium]